MNEPDGFLSRWSRRKAQVKAGAVVSEESAPEPPRLAHDVPAPSVSVAPMALAVTSETAPTAELVPTVAPACPEELKPTLADVALLTRESDYSRFVAPGVDGQVRNAAMKKLFTDPHFNVMDGLDTYIDDYGKPDPIPESMLRMMRQSKFLGLFDDEEKDVIAPADTESAAEPLVAPAEPGASIENTTHEDTDLRLQQDHVAGRPGPDQGAGA